MKISYKQNYKSIRNFSEINTPDFFVITGYNGSGKTHFLKGIVEGMITVDNIQQSEISYFEYKDFNINNDPQKYNDEKQKMFNRYNSSKSQIQNKIISKQGGFTDIKKNFLNILLSHSVLIIEETSLEDILKRNIMAGGNIENEDFESVKKFYFELFDKFKDFFYQARSKKNIFYHWNWMILPCHLFL